LIKPRKKQIKINYETQFPINVEGKNYKKNKIKLIKRNNLKNDQS
jgi:hypothetical protein